MGRHMMVLPILVVLAIPAAASAQEIPECSYTTCALRLETSSGFFSELKVVRGWPGEEIADADRSPELEALLTQVDSAGAFYFRFAERERRSNRLNLIGGLAWGVGYVLTQHGRSDTQKWIGAGLSLGGAVTSIVGSVIGRRAGRDLSRAIWWYNAGAAGEAETPEPIR